MGSLPGMAGEGTRGVSASPQWQSTQVQTDTSGLQQQGFGFLTSTEILQHDEGPFDVSRAIEAFAWQPQSDGEFNTNGCKPSAAVANTNSAASIVRLIFGLLFMVLLPAQMIEGRSEQVKTNYHSSIIRQVSEASFLFVIHAAYTSKPTQSMAACTLVRSVFSGAQFGLKYQART